MDLNSLTVLFVKMTSSYFFAIFSFLFFPRYIPIQYLRWYLSIDTTRSYSVGKIHRNLSMKIFYQCDYLYLLIF